jgi:hypothetical protein
MNIFCCLLLDTQLLAENHIVTSRVEENVSDCRQGSFARLIDIRKVINNQHIARWHGICDVSVDNSFLKSIKVNNGMSKTRAKAGEIVRVVVMKMPFLGSKK